MDILIGPYTLHDMTPRRPNGDDRSHTMEWLRLRDGYAD